MVAPEASRTRHVRTFDLTVSTDREDYEDLIAGETEGPIRVVREMDFAMGGTGAIMRVIDFTKPVAAAPAFAYEAPGLLMPVWFENCGCYRRAYKVWRYPGVPIPRRLQSTYRDPSMNGKKRR